MVILFRLLIGLAGALIMGGSFFALIGGEKKALEDQVAISKTPVMDIDPQSPQSANGVVHVSGTVSSNQSLSDPQYGFQAPGIRLSRNVQMYQWKEAGDGSRVVSDGPIAHTQQTKIYKPIWSASLIAVNFVDVDGKQVTNPTQMLPAAIFVSSQVTLGSLTVSPDLIAKLTGDVACPISESTALPGNARYIQNFPGEWYFAVKESPNQEVGDQRISYTVLASGSYSFVAELRNQTLYPWAVGNTSDSVQAGIHSQQEMLDAIKKGILVKAVAMRMIVALCMMVGVLLVHLGLRSYAGLYFLILGLALFLAPIIWFSARQAS